MSKEYNRFTDVWQLPFKRRCSKVFDANFNMVFDFMHPFHSGMFEGYGVRCVSDEQRDNIVDIINGVVKGSLDENLTHHFGKICIDKDVLILIRGWGHLTGCGGLNLQYEDAARLQDELGEFIVNKLLNNEQKEETEFINTDRGANANNCKEPGLGGI